MTVSDPLRFAVAVASTIALFSGSANAIQIRHSGSRYNADLGRVYGPCLAPNTMSSTGIPACTPAVTSACAFDSGAIDLRNLPDSREVIVDVQLNNVSGPGNCATGPYTLKLGLRISVDDATCASGSCTLIDSEVSMPLVLDDDDFEIDKVSLEPFLPGVPPAIANFEVLHAYIQGPDGLPIAGAGTEDENSADVRTDLGAAYPACTAPDTANAWAVPACSAPVWASACDFWLMDVNLNRSTPGPRIQPRALGLSGVPADCANGTYTFVPRLRITTLDCGALCTLVDLDVPLLATATHGEIDITTLPVVTSTVPLGFLTSNDDLQLLGFTVVDPLGDLLAASVVTPTLHIDRPRVRVSYRDTGNPNDDSLVMKGEFPHPAVDPTIGGATFTLTGKDGLAYTATLPAGSWVVKKPGRHWMYKDDLGTVNGVRVAEFREFSRSHTPTGFKVRLMAKSTSAAAANQPSLDMMVTVSGGAGEQVATRTAICKRSTKRVSCK